MLRVRSVCSNGQTGGLLLQRCVVESIQRRAFASRRQRRRTSPLLSDMQYGFFLNVNKDPGMLSTSVIDDLRTGFRIGKCGHGGTLDPPAEGVLPIACGPATRLIPYLPKSKVYTATFWLGAASSSDDVETPLTFSVPASSVPNVFSSPPDGVTVSDEPSSAWIADESSILDPSTAAERAVEDIQHVVEAMSMERLQEALNEVAARKLQTVPLYSAAHMDGQRLHKIARRGDSIELADLPSRSVTIDRIQMHSAALRQVQVGETFAAVIELQATIECSTGTYIRSIARDVGNLFGIGGVMPHLRRDSSSGMNLDDSIRIDDMYSPKPDGSFGMRPDYDLLRPHRINPCNIIQQPQLSSLPRKVLWRICQGAAVRIPEHCLHEESAFHALVDPSKYAVSATQAKPMFAAEYSGAEEALRYVSILHSDPYPHLYAVCVLDEYGWLHPKTVIGNVSMTSTA